MKVQQIGTRSEGAFWGAMLLAFALLLSAPFFSPSCIIRGFDIPFHFVRIEGIAEGLAAGHFPVRVNPAQLGGYGMPTGIFYPGLFLYLPAALHAFWPHLPLLACWDAFLTLINIATAFAGWWAFARVTGSLRVGAVASLLYLTGFFRLVTLYIGSGVPTLLAGAFFPAALAAVWLTLRRDAADWPSVVLWVSCVLMSHVLSGLFLCAAIAVLALVSLPRFARPDVRRATVLAALATALCNIWFYAPLLYYHRHMDYVMKSVTQSEIWYWAVFPLSGFACYVGTGLAVLAALVAVALVARSLLHGGRLSATVGSYWWLAALALAATLAIASPALWHALGTAAGFLQFPARLAIFPAMLLALAVACGAETLSLLHGRRRALALAAILLALGTNALWIAGYTGLPPHPRTEPAEAAMLRLDCRPAAPVLAEIAAQGATLRDYMDTAALVAIDARVQSPSAGATTDARLQAQFQDTAIHAAPDVLARITHVGRRGTDITLTIAAGPAGAAQLPLFWYDGYTAATADSQPIEAYRDADSQVSVQLPPAAATIHVTYAGLPWFPLTDALSLATIVALALAAFLRSYRPDRKKGSHAV